MPLEEGPIDHPLSQKKLEANRRNARLSRGPVTARGRAVSSQNGRKYNIMPLESPALPAQLTALFYGYFVPVGKTQRSRVDKVIHSERMRHYRASIQTRIQGGEINDHELRSMLDALASASRQTAMIPFEQAAAERDYNARRRLGAIRPKAA